MNSAEIMIRPKKTVRHPSKIHSFAPLVDGLMDGRMVYHMFTCHFPTSTVTTIPQDYNTRNTVTIDDVDFSFFLLLLPTVGSDELQQL
jgi:hypothetical protein